MNLNPKVLQPKQPSSPKLRGRPLLEHLLTVSRRMAEMHDLEPLLSYAIDEVLQLVGAERGYIVLLQEDGTLDFKVKRRADGTDLATGADLISHSILQKVVQTNKSLIVSNAMGDPRFAQAHSVMIMGLRSIMCAPLMTQSRTIGAIYVENRTIKSRFVDEDLAPLEFFSNQAAVTIENAYLYNNLETLVEERTEELLLALESLQKTQDELIEAKQKAEAANQAKSEFLSNMSHELRSPLNAILGFAQLMRRHQKLPPQHSEHLGIILRSGEHLLTLINNVLDLSKIEAGRTTLNPKAFDLYRLLDDLEDMFMLKAESKHLSLLFERAPTLPHYVRTDAVKLRQVLINLLNNALKFTHTGGVSVRVDALQQGWLHFEIEDTGAGIAPEEMKMLFEAFTQTKSGRQAQEGTGLGLSISRQFVQLMGGEISVRSQVGVGTLFTFEIAVEVAAENEIKIQQPSRRVIALAPEQPPIRILAVDDKANNRLLLNKLLTPLGFEVREASNGQEAIEIWETYSPHLIWMDMRMPICDGYEATKHIKATTKGQATAIIGLTASILEENRAVVLNAGCDDFMRKPFRETDLFEMMHKHLGVRYIYEEKSIQEKAKAHEVKGLTPTTLAALPATLRAQLSEAAQQANMSEIEHLIKQIRAIDAEVAAGVATLANEFEYGRILELIQAVQVTD